MKENKKYNILIILVFVLSIICILMGIFLIINREKLDFKYINKNEIQNKENIKNKEKEKDCAEISYALKTNEYGLSASRAGINVFVDQERQMAEISYNKYILSKTFSLDLAENEEKSIYENTDKKHFNKKINEVLIDGSGQDALSLTILYLMEDGTIEYVPILKDLKTNWKEKDNTKIFNSYGKLNKVEGIISLISAEGKGYHTVLGRKADGSVIDLADAFLKAGI